MAKRKKSKRRPPRPRPETDAGESSAAAETRPAKGRVPARTAERVAAGDVEVVDDVDPDQPRWGLGDVFGGWILVFVASGFIGAVILAGGDYSFGAPAIGEQIGAVAGQIVQGETPTLPQPTPLWLRMVLQTPLWAGLLAVPYLVSRFKGRGWVQDFGLRMARSDIGVGLAAGVAAQLVLIQGFYWLVFRVIGERDVAAEARELTDRVVDPFGLVLLVLIVGVGAPIAEEVFFRGFAQRAFEKRGMAWQWAVFCTALFFAFSHLQPLQFPGLLIFGAIAGWLVHRAGRIGPAIWAHLGFNLTAVVTLTVTL